MGLVSLSNYIDENFVVHRLISLAGSHASDYIAYRILGEACCVEE